MEILVDLLSAAVRLSSRVALQQVISSCVVYHCSTGKCCAQEWGLRCWRVSAEHHERCLNALTIRKV